MDFLDFTFRQIQYKYLQHLYQNIHLANVMVLIWVRVPFHTILRELKFPDCIANPLVIANVSHILSENVVFLDRVLSSRALKAFMLV